jgi:hypothetical protein
MILGICGYAAFMAASLHPAPSARHRRANKKGRSPAPFALEASDDAYCEALSVIAVV